MKNQELNLRDWYEMKQTISELTKKCEKQRKIAEKIMKDENINIIKQGGMKVERKIQQKTSVNKKNIPKEVWEKYATISRYDAFYMKKLKKD